VAVVKIKANHSPGAKQIIAEGRLVVVDYGFPVLFPTAHPPNRKVKTDGGYDSS
jgi:hypothetical protein